MIQAAFWISASAITAIVLDRIGLWAEAKGWVYWRRKKASSTSIGAILSDLNAVTNPSAQHVVEAKQSKKLEERDNSDPPECADECATNQAHGR
ncbi:MAG: hypothetical protein WAU68_02275 [Vitreimonas sp.]